MKKLILFAGLSVLLVLEAGGQVYHPFPVKNVKWTNYLEFGLSEKPPDTTILCYVFNGDTTIKSIVYSRLCLQSGDSLHPLFRGIGGLRENNKKIYYVGSDLLGFPSDNEVLLYDFSAKAGDTVYHADYFKTIILSIDSVLIDSSYRKRFKINSNNNFHFKDEYWVEGIGNMRNGLLGHITHIPTCCFEYWESICFSENGRVKYLNSRFNDCFPRLYNGITAETPNEHKIVIYPNPVDNLFSVGGIEKGIEYDLQISDMTGKVLFTAHYSGGINQAVNFPWPNGLYLVKIVRKGGIITNNMLLRETP